MEPRQVPAKHGCRHRISPLCHELRTAAWQDDLLQCQKQQPLPSLHSGVNPAVHVCDICHSRRADSSHLKHLGPIVDGLFQSFHMAPSLYQGRNTSLGWRQHFDHTPEIKRSAKWLTVEKPGTQSAVLPRYSLWRLGEHRIITRAHVHAAIQSSPATEHSIAAVVQVRLHPCLV